MLSRSFERPTRTEGNGGAHDALPWKLDNNVVSRSSDFSLFCLLAVSLFASFTSSGKPHTDRAMSVVDDLIAGSFPKSMSSPHAYIAISAFLVCVLVASVILFYFQKSKIDYDSGMFTYLKFAYANFLKPHERGGEGNQQHALESFYKTQVRHPSCGLTVKASGLRLKASVYDATRKRLLRGREDMLGLAAAQLKFKVEKNEIQAGKLVWVDVSTPLLPGERRY